MGGTPPAAYPDFIASQQWYMMTGTPYTAEGVGILSSDTMSSDSETATILPLIEDLLTVNTSGDNPYSGVTLYSATSSGQPLQSALSAIDSASSYLDTLYTYSSVYSSGVGWAAYFAQLHNTVSCYFDEEPLTDTVNALEDRVWGRLVREIGTLNAGYAANNAVFTSSRIIAQALAVRDAARSIDEQEGKMAYDRAKYITEAAATLAENMVKIDYDKFARLAAESELYAKMADLKNTFSRQYIDDNLQMDIHDTLWDLELWRYAQKGIGALAGINPMPEQPNPILQGLSTALAFGSAIVPWL